VVSLADCAASIIKLRLTFGIVSIGVIVIDKVITALPSLLGTRVMLSRSLGVSHGTVLIEVLIRPAINNKAYLLLNQKVDGRKVLDTPRGA